MKVILLEEVRSLGEPGTLVDVADGYARNYLLPRKLAVEANQGAVKSLEHHKRIAARRLGRLQDSAKVLAKRLGEVRLTLTAKAGEAGKMYGSVTAGQIADELERVHGLSVDKRKIHLAEPIKVLGEHTVEIRPRPDVRAELTVEVVAEAEEPKAETAPEGPVETQPEPAAEAPPAGEAEAAPES
jgi:large subunit ribosomal protein L9